jgi:hypothetical protein
MMLFTAILFLMLCFSTSMIGQSEEADPYSVKLVQAALKTRSGGLIIATVQTHLARMGDGAAIASGITQNRPVRVTSKPANGEGLGH